MCGVWGGRGGGGGVGGGELNIVGKEPTSSFESQTHWVS